MRAEALQRKSTVLQRRGFHLCRRRDRTFHVFDYGGSPASTQSAAHAKQAQKQNTGLNFHVSDSCRKRTYAVQALSVYTDSAPCDREPELLESAENISANSGIKHGTLNLFCLGEKYCG